MSKNNLPINVIANTTGDFVLIVDNQDNMRALVTGCAGFIGSHLCDRLLKMEHEVIGIDDLSAGYLENVPEGVEFTCVDVCDINLSSFGEIDVVFHLAASKKNICLTDPKRDLDVNGKGTLHLLMESKKNGVKKFVHSSTGSVYGEVDYIDENTPCRPVSYYGCSKLAGESYVNMFDIDSTVLRYFHVYGERQETDSKLGGVVAIFKSQIAKGLSITIHGDGNQERVFTKVGDIVEANIQSWLNPLSKNKVYNCASSKSITINQLAKSLKAIGKVGITYTEPLEGDIYKFNVNADKIKEIGVTFQEYE